MNQDNPNKDEEVGPKLHLLEDEETLDSPLEIDHSKIIDTNESGEEEFGVELVSMISAMDSSEGKVKKKNLYENNALVDLSQHTPGGIAGKSFRSKELSEDDIVEIEMMPTLEEQWIADEHRKPSHLWLKKLIIVGLVLLSYVSVRSLLSFKKEDDALAEKAKEIKQFEVNAGEKREAYLATLLSTEECIRSYLQATNIEERASFCRNPESTLSKMKDYYTLDRPFQPSQLGNVLEMLEMKISGTEAVVASVMIINPEHHSDEEIKGFFLLVKHSDGRYLVDWEAYVAYQPNDWASFILSKGNEPLMFRIHIEERINHGPYLYDFSDDQKYQAYKIKIQHDQDDDYLMAYSKIGSVVNEKINKILLEKHPIGSYPKMIAPMMLKIAFPKDAASPQCVEIIEVVSDSWFLPTLNQKE